MKAPDTSYNREFSVAIAGLFFPVYMVSIGITVTYKENKKGNKMCPQEVFLVFRVFINKLNLKFANLPVFLFPIYSRK